jgi:hypothetical protein
MTEEQKQQDDKTPQFLSHSEALDYYLDRLPKLQSTQEILHALRETVIHQKASLVVDADGSLARAAAESAYLHGQIWLLEKMIAGGHVVTN